MITMSPMLISIAVFLGVAALVGGVAIALRDRSAVAVEDRLDSFTGHGGAANRGGKDRPSLLAHPLDDAPDMFEKLLQRFGRLRLLFEQADTNLSPTAFFAFSAGLAGGGWLVAWFMHSPVGIYPVAAIGGGVLPLFWLLHRRRKRLKVFAAQLPDGLELLARALRAGHSLQAGFGLVAEEMPAPIGKEFGRVFEEQNLGISMEEALRAMTDRVPNLDLKFFVTAVILQRQTGGDLAEILDKIGRLIRERFTIWGQIQALTGEGRLSGIVLLALPPVLFLAVYRLNPEYIMVLFTDPMGKKMLAGALVMQVLGAIVIKKIINIKV